MKNVCERFRGPEWSREIQGNHPSSDARPKDKDEISSLLR